MELKKQLAQQQGSDITMTQPTILQKIGHQYAQLKRNAETEDFEDEASVAASVAACKHLGLLRMGLQQLSKENVLLCHVKYSFCVT